MRHTKYRKDSVIMSIADLEVKVKTLTCNDCHNTFTEDQADVYTETHGFSEGPYEYFLTCPACGCGNLKSKGGLPWLNL